ncbi:MAG TPA: hypothetical protein VLI05_05380 [Candidatus Saccharimonadia bacterium]|nr:hypothetical protein [Candidatus Saccharimonadia bacterium]
MDIPDLPADAPAPDVSTIDEIEGVICVLSANDYVPDARAFFKSHGVLDRQWVSDHLGYFSTLEDKLRYVIMVAWNPTGTSAPARREAAEALGISLTTLYERLSKARKAVCREFESRRQAYIEGLSPERLIHEPAAVLDVRVYYREALRQAGFRTLAEVCDLDRNAFRNKLPEELRRGGHVEYYEKALAKLGLSFSEGAPA